MLCSLPVYEYQGGSLNVDFTDKLLFQEATHLCGGEANVRLQTVNTL